jgi:ATP-binding cassette subfamily F protein 3
MLLLPANTLLLDEPTNHLDPASVDVLTDALTDFPGTIVFISHDPVFLTRVATRVVEIENGQALDYLGDYEYYLWKRARELEEAPAAEVKKAERNGRTAPPPRPVKPTPQALERRDLTKALGRTESQLQRMEDAIARLEEQIRARTQELVSPELYQDHVRWYALDRERQAWEADLERLMQEWASLLGRCQSLQQQLQP